MNATPPSRTACFLRVEETLLPARDVAACLYMASNSPGTGRRLGRLSAVAASLPAMGALALGDRRMLRRLSFLHWRGLGSDRVGVLAQEFYERFLADRPLRPKGQELLTRARREGHRIFLLTTGLESVMAPLADRLEADALLGHSLELRDGVATGKLLETWGGEDSGWLIDLARRERINLRGSYGYGTDATDLGLLSAVGFPCAVNPDLRVRRAARREGWPVLEVS